MNLESIEHTSHQGQVIGGFAAGLGERPFGIVAASAKMLESSRFEIADVF